MFKVIQEQPIKIYIYESTISSNLCAGNSAAIYCRVMNKIH